MAAPRRVPWKKLALGAVLVGALGAFFASGGPGWLSLAAFREHRDALLAYRDRNFAVLLVAAALVYALATALSFPGGVLMSLSVGFLFGRWVGTALVVVAATTGATAAFLSARYLFADAVRRRMGPRLGRLAAGFERDAFNYMLFVRLVPVFPFWLMNLVPALTPVSVRTFAAGTALGILPGSFVFVYAGESLGSIESTRGLVSPRVLLSLALLGALALVPILWKKMRNRPPGAPA
ncbi:MAG TPA: VTT domain-containing protein [Longimicrobium sp.]|nr:VTT domain-containing protein [Longimicrobium sp.]